MRGRRRILHLKWGDSGERTYVSTGFPLVGGNDAFIGVSGKRRLNDVIPRLTWNPAGDMCRNVGEIKG